jgi:magnesium-transporting ATPase (P-type)
MALAGIVACQVGNVLACRTDRASIFQVGLGSNRVVLWGIATELGVLTLLIEVPFFQSVFGLVPLRWADLALLPLFPVILLGVEELRKAWLRAFRP